MKPLLHYVFLSVLFISAYTPPAFAELEQIVVDRPPSSGQHVDQYIETDQGQIKESVSTGIMQKAYYNVYLPNGETQIAPYKRPAILLLHGAKRTGASLVERWQEVADRNDVILIGPHANPAWNPSKDGQGRLTTILNDAVKKYNIDTSRVYLFGHSMGGNMAWVMAATNPHQFAAIGIHAGNVPPNIYNIYSSIDRHTPIVVLNGTQDRGFPIKAVAQTAEAIAGYGYDIDLYIIKNHGHWYYDIAPMLNDVVWDFFQGKSL